MEFRIRLARDKLETCRVCLEEVAVVESGLKRPHVNLTLSIDIYCYSKAVELFQSRG
jgi:hypothetical protein